MQHFVTNFHSELASQGVNNVPQFNSDGDIDSYLKANYNGAQGYDIKDGIVADLKDSGFSDSVQNGVDSCIHVTYG